MLIAGQVAILALSILLCVAGFLATSAVCRMTPGGIAHVVDDFRSYLSPELDEFAKQRRARQFTSVMSSAGMVALVNIINVFVLCGVLFSVRNDINVVWWGVAIALMASFQLDACMRMRGKTVDVDTARRILNKVTRNVFIFGVAWGAGATFFLGAINEMSGVILCLALLGTAAGGVAALAVLPPAAILFASAVSAPVICRFLESGDQSDLALAAYTMVLLFTFGAISAGGYGASIKRPALAALGRESECGGVGCNLQVSARGGAQGGRGERAAGEFQPG